MNVEELVAQVGLFKGLKPKHLTHIARCTKSEQFSPGQVIVSQGDIGQVLYIVSSGAVEVRRERPGQTSVVLDILDPGRFFGEMALLDDFPRSATVVATEDTECLSLGKWHFLVELESHPDLAVAMLPEMSRRLRQVLQQLEAQI